MASAGDPPPTRGAGHAAEPRMRRYVGADDDEDAEAKATVGDSLQALEALVSAAPEDRQLRRALSTAYLRAGRLAEAKDQQRTVEALIGRRRSQRDL